MDAMLCQDLEALAWYSEESASGIVEELIRTHLTTNADLLAKAKEARTVSQAARQSVGAM